jgi:hypothetical protein
MWREEGPAATATRAPMPRCSVARDFKCVVGQAWLSLPGQRDERQPRSGWRLVVAAQEVDDLADGWFVGHHAGVAFVLV